MDVSIEDFYRYLFLMKIRNINCTSEVYMEESVKLVFDKILILWKKRNPAIKEFHISLAKIIFVFSIFSPLFKQILFQNLFR